jgi:hypothetical protein
MSITPGQDSTAPETPVPETENPTPLTENPITDPDTQPDTPESAEQIDDNFFAEVNAEYNRLAEEGNLTAETMTEILARNHQTWFQTFVDAISNPVDAFEHIGLRAWDYLKNSVMSRISAVFAPILVLKDQIFGIISSPFPRVAEIADRIIQIPGLSALNLESPETFQRSLVLIEDLGLNSGVLTAFATLYQYLRDNPEVSQNVTEEQMQDRNWWNTVFQQAGITSHQDELFAIVTNPDSISATILGTAAGATVTPAPTEPAPSPEAPATAQPETLTEAPEGMIALNDFADERIASLSQLTEKVHDIAADTMNQDKVLTYLAIGGLLTYFRAPVFAGLSTATRFTAGSMATMARKCASLSSVAFRFGLNHPMLSFGGLMAGSAAVAMYLEHKQATAVGDTIYIPENPEVLKREILEFTENSPEWRELQSAMPASSVAELELGIHYMTNPEELDDLVRTFEADRFIDEVYESSLDSVGLTDAERINNVNAVGLRNLQSGLRVILNLNPDEQADLEGYLETKMIQVENNGISPELIAELQAQLSDYGVQISLGEDGYYYYSSVSEDGTTTPYPYALFVDPALPQSRQHELARTFTTDPTRMFGLSGIAENLIAGDIREVVEDINNGGVVVTVGNIAYMVMGEVINPIGAATMVLEGLTAFNDDDSWQLVVHQTLTDWGDGLVPMMAIGLPLAFVTGTDGRGVRGYFTNVLKRVGRIALYPATITQIQYSLLKATVNESHRLRLGAELISTMQQRTFLGRWMENSVTNRLYFNTDIGRMFSGDTNTTRILACKELEALLKSRLGYSLLYRNDFVRDNFQERLRQLLNTSDLGIRLTDDDILRMNRENALNLLNVVSNRYTAYLRLLYPDGFARPVLNAAGSTARWLTSSGGSFSHRAGRGAALYTAAAGAAAAITYSMSNDDGSNVRSADQMTTDDRLLALETLSDAPASSDQSSSQLDSLRTNIEAEQADLPEYLLQIETACNPYREVRDFMAPNNISNLSEDQAFIRVNDLGNMHMLQTETLLEIVTEHKADLISYLQAQSNPDDPDYEPAMYLAEGAFIIKLNPDNPSDLLVEYSSKDAFMESLWANYDARITINEATEGQDSNNPMVQLTNLQNSTRDSLTSILNDQTLSEQAKDEMIQRLLNSYLSEEEEIQVDMRNLQAEIAAGNVALDVLPITGHVRDLERLNRTAQRGHYWRAFLNAGTFATTTLLDVAFLGTAGVGARIAAAAARLAPMVECLFRFGRSVRTALAASRAGRGSLIAGRFLLNVGRHALIKPQAYLLALTGMDLFRTLYISPTIDEEQTI